MTRRTLATALEITESLRIATQAHDGQKRSDGSPYIFHPIRVANNVREELKPAAHLHDVLEDTKLTEATLREIFSTRTVDIVVLLTHKPGESYVDYIKRIGEDAEATEVKLADLGDNLLNHKPGARRDKYELAQWILCERMVRQARKVLTAQ
jgi:(p)ppGpp synthase/HD superfamily hydrolase